LEIIMKLVFLGVLSIILTATIQAGDDKADSKALEGTWSLSSAVMAGKPFPEQLVKTMSLTMKDGRYTVMVGQGKDEGTAKHDASKYPKTMDITGTDGPNKGKTMLAIYKIDGDALTICYDLSGKSTPDSTLFLVEYKRDKSSK
jgi:uncharacterized protein (TIGR03067 family)